MSESFSLKASHEEINRSERVMSQVGCGRGKLARGDSALSATIVSLTTSSCSWRCIDAHGSRRAEERLRTSLRGATSFESRPHAD